MTDRRTINNLEGESSRKRSRQVRAQDDQVLDTREARSNLHHNHPAKRVRISAAGPSKSCRLDTPSLSDDEDEGSMDEDVNCLSVSPPKTQYETIRDAGFAHLLDEQGDDEYATQRMRARNKSAARVENNEAVSGILESITCYNFMCHERLHVELGPLLNFIVGENGSGKSAVLTAITLCLGGKASSTNRGGSLRAFVKEGTDKGLLVVKIKNKGGDAYQPENYGHSIFVERYFSKTASSGYKIKNANGHVVSTKRQEMDDIVEHFALQVDNPLNVLSQDNARQFLNAASKTQKYKFFAEGVQLQQLDTDYKLIQESIERFTAKIPQQREIVHRAGENFKQAKRLYESWTGSRDLRNRHRSLINQLGWRRVKDEEDELADRERAILELEAEINTAEQRITEQRHELDIHNDKIDKIQQDVQTLKEDESNKRAVVEDRREAYSRIKGELSTLHHDERDAHDRARSAATEVNEREKKIAAEEVRLEEANGGAVLSKQQEKEKAQADLRKLVEELDACQCLQKEVQNELKNAENASTADRAARSEKNEAIMTAQTRLRTLETGGSGRYDAYEAGMGRLVKMIEDSHPSQFQQKPIGPLGVHVQLTQPRWSSVLEKYFGLNLNAFIVANKNDQKLLHEWMKGCNIRSSPILIASLNGPSLDTTSKEPDSDFDTILRVLKIDHAAVRNQLIILHMSEQVILEADRKKGESVMFDGAPPRNVKACLVFHDGKQGHGLLLKNNNGNLSTSPVGTGIQRQVRMKTNLSSQIAAEKAHLVRLQSELHELDSNSQGQISQSARLQEELHREKVRQKDLQGRSRQMQVVIERIENELEEFQGVGTRLQSLRDMLVQAKETQNHFGNMYAQLNLDKQDKNEELERARHELKGAEEASQKLERQTRKLEEKLQRFEQVQRVSLQQVNETVAAKQQLEETERTARTARRDRQKRRLEASVAEAKEYSVERVPIDGTQTAAHLEKLIDKVAKQLERARERNGGKMDDQIGAEYEQAKAEYESGQLLLAQDEDLMRRMNKALQLRLWKWRQFQRMISSASRVTFKELLRKRRFEGNLQLDHVHKTLDLQIQPVKGEVANEHRTTRTLSGGEKSFASICMLLAIWEAMGSPLRCLDEFDVFMDNVNRKISTNMLIEAAQRSFNRQYIFITPNAIQGIREPDLRGLKIHRLTDPRQRTLT